MVRAHSPTKQTDGTNCGVIGGLSLVAFLAMALKHDSIQDYISFQSVKHVMCTDLVDTGPMMKKLSICTTDTKESVYSCATSDRDGSSMPEITSGWVNTQMADRAYVKRYSRLLHVIQAQQKSKKATHQRQGQGQPKVNRKALGLKITKLLAGYRVRAQFRREYDYGCTRTHVAPNRR